MAGKFPCDQSGRCGAGEPRQGIYRQRDKPHYRNIARQNLRLCCQLLQIRGATSGEDRAADARLSEPAEADSRHRGVYRTLPLQGYQVRTGTEPHQATG